MQEVQHFVGFMRAERSRKLASQAGNVLHSVFLELHPTPFVSKSFLPGSLNNRGTGRPAEFGFPQITTPRAHIRNIP